MINYLLKCGSGILFLYVCVYLRLIINPQPCSITLLAEIVDFGLDYLCTSRQFYWRGVCLPFASIKAIEDIAALHDLVHMAYGRLAIGYGRGDFDTWLLDMEIAVGCCQLRKESVIYEVVILAKREGATVVPSTFCKTINLRVNLPFHLCK